VSATIPADRRPSATASTPVRAIKPRLGPLDILVLSAWCGLASGLLEVVTRCVARSYFTTNQLYLMSRHFTWLAPLSDLMLFSAVGLFLALAAKLWPRFGRWFGPRLICFLAILPVLMVLSPRIYPMAWALLALGTAVRMASFLERRATRLLRWLLPSFPGLLGLVVVLAGWVVGGEWREERREAGRPLPAGDPPNILLITLDTVRADHLSLYGYGRRTSPALERLASRGIRFEEAHAPAPWTLPSHASMFTGRWHHELNVDWMTPLNTKRPTLAEYLGSHGYATAGFVANLFACSYDSGLNRGFTHYEDYILEGLVPLRTAWLVECLARMTSDLGMVVGRVLNAGPFRTVDESWLVPSFEPFRRKDAGSINRAFLGWLSHRRQPARPFFAFLNYYDAHAPYLLPTGAKYRFGLRPRRPADFILLKVFWELVDKTKLRPVHQRLALDSYDNCVAYLVERLNDLFDELQSRGVLDRTLVIVTADHGEGMGEHGLFDHGESVYRPEIHVPLVIVLPMRARATGVVRETVSLRNLPATILDLTGLREGSPLPGRSLADLWRHDSRAGPIVTDVVISELPKPNPYDPNRGRSPAWRGPLVSVAEDEFVYIRNQGDGTEELYNEREDPGDERDLSRVQAMQPVLERLRRHLDQLK
jgi:arylsulfatase A-like enzyme